MSSQIINISSSENILDFLTSYLPENLHKTAIVSGGKRPFLFVKKKLIEKKKESFYPPAFFTNDEFMERIFFNNNEFSKIPDLEAVYTLYKITENEIPEILNEKKKFEGFMQWAFEILKFIEQLDLEKVSEYKIKNIKANAEIGFDVPENINNLIKNIFKVRQSFHKHLEDKKMATKGYAYYKASEISPEQFVQDFDEIILFAPFYLHKSELDLYKKIYDLGKLTVMVQGNPNKFPSLKGIYNFFNYPMPDNYEEEVNTKINIYSAYDDQSQALLLKNILSKEINSKEDYSKSVVIVPKDTMIQQVVSEISQLGIEYNVSSGYFASKTAVYALIDNIFQAQFSKRENKYYVKDVVKILTNPLVKNMRFFGDLSVSRIIVHKIEEALDLSSSSKLAGRLFIDINDMLNDEELLNEISETVVKTWDFITREKISAVLKQIWDVLFGNWQEIKTLSGLSNTILLFIEKLISLSSLQSYPLNVEAAEIIINCAKELNFGEVSKQIFETDEIIKIFSNLLKDRKITLQGSPLKGLQVLGLLESRNLSFENVFITAMTDAAIPALTKDFPLIPKEIMYSLGIEIASRDFEIQEYHFNRLISSAKNVYFIYPDNEKEERSRFIEKIIWQEQLKTSSLNTVKIKQISIAKPEISSKEKRKYNKTKDILKYLGNMKYSYTKIDTYLKCRLEFYFRYILGLDENIEVGKDLSGSDIGKFVHEFLQSTLSEKLSFKDLNTEKFQRYYLQKLSEQFDRSFDINFREDAFLIKKVLIYRLSRFLEFQKKKEFDEIFGCEKRYEANIETNNGSYKLECIIDRIDIKNGNYQIYDYKTGKVESKLVTAYFDGLSKNSNSEDIKKAVKSFQLPLYKYIFEQNTGFKVKECGLFDIKKSELITFPDNKEIFEKSMDIIRKILDEINSPGYFEIEENDSDKCQNCKYLSICR